MKKNNFGFTLVECMVCLTIVSIILCISIPAFSKISNRQQYRGEVGNLISALRYAKTSAIRGNCPAVIQIKKNGFVLFLDKGEGGLGYGDWVMQEGEEVLLKHVLPKGIKISSNFSKDRLRFRGVPGIKAGSIYLEDENGRSTRVVLNIVGRIRTEISM